MNHLVTVCLTIVAIVAVICATVLALDGQTAEAAWSLASACVAGPTGYTIGKRSAEAS